MRLSVAACLTLVLLGLGAPPAASAQVDPVWFGTWALDLDESTYEPGPAPYRRGICRIEPWGAGVRMVYDLVGVRGGVTHLEWSGTLDGREYAVQGLDVVMTYSYARLDDRTWEVTVRLDGRAVGTARVTISADGERLTTVTTVDGPGGQAVSSTTVYERQDS